MAELDHASTGWAIKIVDQYGCSWNLEDTHSPPSGRQQGCGRVGRAALCTSHIQHCSCE